MYKRILVAVDGSETSDLAVHEAIKLVKDQQAALRLVHVVDLTPAYMAGVSPYPLAEYEKACREGGEKILATGVASVRDAGIEPEQRLVIVEKCGRRIYQAIVEEAEEWPADLIVMGTHGRRGFQHMFIGSVAERVIRVATKPVLLIRGA